VIPFGGTTVPARNQRFVSGHAFRRAEKCAQPCRLHPLCAISYRLLLCGVSGL